MSCLVRYGDIALPISFEVVSKDLHFCDLNSHYATIVENPIYFLVGSRDQLQVTAGLSPKNITGVLFQKMTFNSKRNTLAFALEVIWKPPIYQNLIGAFRENMGAQCSKALGSEIRQTVNQLTITVDIPSKNEKTVTAASFSKMELYRDSKGITILEFDVPVLLKPSDPFVKDPIYEEIISDEERAEHGAVAPQVNIKTDSNKVILQGFNSEPITESVVWASLNLYRMSS